MQWEYLVVVHQVHNLTGTSKMARGTERPRAVQSVEAALNELGKAGS